MAKIELIRVQGDYGFETIDDNDSLTRIDGSPEIGGRNFGARPMNLLLNALAGCASIDVIMILKKQKQDVTGYKVVINAEKEQDKEFYLWKNIDMTFYVSGNVEEGRVKRAVELSMNKYCSVAETLKRAGAKINTNIVVNQ
ncbi:OsmC family protein [Haoranjiania flava]|uniref:OsmC family protein n=1 Tax=Haoranjiania flava TaxID=1856322 RepID=A0AAE3IP39_9BACT|nr:OsmC family protein [Haoranjiania flava]MCU7695529.1 OsmC family protein [Haoranjiania flava]